MRINDKSGKVVPSSKELNFERAALVIKAALSITAAPVFCSTDVSVHRLKSKR